jgi:hypothetical protein
MNFRVALPSDQFTYYAAEKCFTSEASDLRGNHIQRLYGSASALGFVMQSSRTGVQVEYVLHQSHTDGENEVTFWEYRPSPRSEFATPSCIGTVVKIFND